MHRSAILTASLLSALGLVYVGCTQNFDQFEPAPTGGPGSTVSSTSGGNVGGAGGGTGGQGGQGGGVGGGAVTSSSSATGGGCMKPADCGMDTPCKTWTCKMGMCDSMNAPAGTPTTDPTPGDCKTLACNANGDEVSATNTGDKPDDMNECTVDDCTAMGMPTFTNAAAGTPCMNGMGACDAMGKCVTPTTCMANADCPSGFCADGYCCDTACDTACNACNLPGKLGTCSTVMSGEDTAGAMTCMGTMTCDPAGACKLKNGQPCMANADCASGNCAGGGNKTCK